MAKLYRVSGIQSSGSASALARALSAIQCGVKVRVDAEHGIVDIHGLDNDFMVADTVKKAGCTYLGSEEV